MVWGREFFLRGSVQIRNRVRQMGCPAGVLDSAHSTRIISYVWCVVQLYLGVPLTFAGGTLFIFLLCLSVFLLCAAPLLAAPVAETLLALAGDGPYTAGTFVTTVLACLVGASACALVLGSRPLVQIQAMVAALGVLLGAFVLGWFVALVPDPLARGWVLLSGTLALTLVLLRVLFTLFPLTTIAALLASVLGPFLVVGPIAELAGGGDVSLAGLVGGDFGACGVGGYAALVLWGALSALAIFLHYKGYLGKGTHIDSAIRCIFQPVFLVNGLITAEFVGEEQAARLLEDDADDEPPTPDTSPLVEYVIAEAPADAPVADTMSPMGGE